MEITILGNNSALPAHERYPTCQIVSVDGNLIMIDCGEAAQILLKKHHISWRKLQYIFISHLHGDHYFGLPGLLNSMSLLGRSQALYLYAPAALEPILMQIFEVADTQLSYPLHFIKLPETASLLLDTNNLSLFCFPVQHRIFCHGLVVTQKSKGRKLLPERCTAYQIPAAFYKKLQAGANYETKTGDIILNEWVTTEGKPSKRYAYCADTMYTESILPYISKVDLLYHESTYLNIDEHKAGARFHSTAAQAALIAQKAEVGQLILGHYSSKYKDIEAFELEAKSIFPNSIATKEGDHFIL